MPIFLLVIMLLLSQEIFSMNCSLNQMEQYEKKGIEEILRGHPELLLQIQQEMEQKSPRTTTPEGQTSILNGSTEKINDNK